MAKIPGSRADALEVGFIYFPRARALCDTDGYGLGGRIRMRLA